MLSGCALRQTQNDVAPPPALPPITQGTQAGQPPNKPCPIAACIYVANRTNGTNGSVTVYAVNATGNVEPYRTISGVRNPTGIALDGRGRTYVSLWGYLVSDAVAVYAPSAAGNANPLRTIEGHATRLSDPVGVALDARGRIYALDTFHNHVTLYAPRASGDVKPIRTIAPRRWMTPEVGGIAVDGFGNTYVTRDNDCISCKSRNKPAVIVYAAGARGGEPPIWVISGSKTTLDLPSGVAVDDSGNVYVADENYGSDRVDVYAAGAHGNVAPIQAITGPKTGLDRVCGLAVDAAHNTYVTSEYGEGPGSVTVYAPGATGNAAPIQTITGDYTGLNAPCGIAIH